MYLPAALYPRPLVAPHCSGGCSLIVLSALPSSQVTNLLAQLLLREGELSKCKRLVSERAAVSPLPLCLSS